MRFSTYAQLITQITDSSTLSNLLIVSSDINSALSILFKIICDVTPGYSSCFSLFESISVKYVLSANCNDSANLSANRFYLGRMMRVIIYNYCFTDFFYCKSSLCIFKCL